MDKNDMILVSIDDHSIEPGDMYKNHVPAKWADQVPKIVRNAQGIDEWSFQGESATTPFGMAATVGWPREEWGFNPGAFSELRPGCFDVHERVRDMPSEQFAVEREQVGPVLVRECAGGDAHRDVAETRRHCHYEPPDIRLC